MRIAITGANGTLGRHLCEVFDHNEILKITHSRISDPNSIQVDLCKYSHELAERLKAFRPTHIIHTAAVQNSNPECYDINISMTVQMVRYASEFKPKFVFISSSTVYGDKGVEKICEIDDAVADGTNAYANSKIDGETFVRLLDNYLIFRPCAIIDPLAKRGLCYDIVQKLKNSSDHILLFGDEPGSIKPYISAQYVASYIATKLNEVGIYNVAPNDNISVKHIVEEAMHISGKNKGVIWAGASANFAGDNPVVAMKSDINASSLDFLRNYFIEAFA